MSAIRRGNGARKTLAVTDESSTVSSSASVRSPFLPTTTEVALLAVYPLTLVLGSAFSHLSPITRSPQTASVYSYRHQSFQPQSEAPSYWATKRNVFNVYFVKFGWFWCTLALVAFIAYGSRASRTLGARLRGRRAGEAGQAAQESAQAEGDTRLRRRMQAFARYVAATTLWVWMTQWFFGAPLIDRGFIASGGLCEVLMRSAEQADGAPQKELVQALTHAACTQAGGRWYGGWDLSGHVFLLVLGSGMLWFEMLPVLMPHVAGLCGARLVKMADGRVVHVGVGSAGNSETSTVEKQSSTPEEAHARKHAQQIKFSATTLSMGVATFSWWMLLMTAAFFHTWVEKLFALVVAFTGLWMIYILPRGVPLLRSIVGMPGV